MSVYASTEYEGKIKWEKMNLPGRWERNGPREFGVKGEVEFRRVVKS